MKTTIRIEIESKDKLMAFPDGNMENEEVNIAEDFHAEVLTNIKNCIERFIQDFPEGIDENYIEGYDDLTKYGLSIKISEEPTIKKW